MRTGDLTPVQGTACGADSEGVKKVLEEATAIRVLHKDLGKNQIRDAAFCGTTGDPQLVRARPGVCGRRGEWCAGRSEAARPVANHGRGGAGALCGL